MLLNFTVENCLSFMSEQEFTMLRKGQRSTQNKQDMRSWISPVAAIYGDNAAGKSNLLKCMNFFFQFRTQQLCASRRYQYAAFSVGSRKCGAAIDVLYRIHC